MKSTIMLNGLPEMTFVITPRPISPPKKIIGVGTGDRGSKELAQDSGSKVDQISGYIYVSLSVNDHTSLANQKGV